MPISASIRAKFQSARPLVLGFVLMLVSGALLFSAGRGPHQPIAFNHAKHVQAGAGCTDCHSGVQEQAHATLPELSTCLTCHETQMSQSSEEAKVRAIAASGQPLLWKQVTYVPPHVYFSHRRHVAIANLQCTECHGDMAKATAPPSKRFRTLDMDDCLGCHEQRKVKTDCNDCHR